MAGLWIPRAPQKPPVGQRINWQHPLSDQLIGLWILNEGAGAPCNLARPQISTVVGSAPPWASTSDGPGLTYPGSGTVNARIQLGATTDYSAESPPYTVVCRGIQRGTVNNFLYSSSIASGTAGYEVLVGISSVAGAVTARSVVSGPPAALNSGTLTLDADEYGAVATYVSAWDYDGTNTGCTLTVHTQRRVLTSTRGTATGLRSLDANGQPLTIGARAATYLVSSSISALWIYRRLLVDSEQAWLHAEPYAMLTR